MSSSESNLPGSAWTQHYEEAAKRRRRRGWHRRDESSRDATRQRDVRLKLYVGAAALFVVATVIAMLLPR
jgi:hypothetical protein